MSFHAFAVFFSLKLLPLLYAIIGFGLVIAIHECGHFLFCKLFGIKTPTFSIGFGPELIRRKIGETDFRLALIPFGGYVEIAGLAEIGQGNQQHASATGADAFSTKSYWKQLLVLSGGIIFNLLSAYIVFCSLFLVGTGDKQGLIVGGIVKNSAAEKYDLRSGDAITGINHTSLQSADGMLVKDASTMLLTAIKAHPNNQIILTVERNNETVELPITLGERIEKDEKIGSLGAELRSPIQRLPFMQAISEGIKTTNGWIVAIVLSIKRLITQRSLEGAGGPVMIMSMSFDAAKNGVFALLTFLALISINLALMNLIPLGALDGGQILFTTLEALIGRKLPLTLRNSINIISWLFFIGLAIFLTYKDIAFLFGDKIMGLAAKLLTVVGLR